MKTAKGEERRSPGQPRRPHSVGTRVPALGVALPVGFPLYQSLKYLGDSAIITILHHYYNDVLTLRVLVLSESHCNSLP